MLAEQLDKAWRTRRGSTPIDAVMRFSDEGLVLGAGTLLAKRGPSSAALSIDPRDQRLHALLAAAHMKWPSAGAIIHLSKAAEKWNEGEAALAAMHLALSGLERLARPESDARRLFLADGMLEVGFDGGDIAEALFAGDTKLMGLEKYDPNQPRVPAGSGATSGEWTSTGDSPSAGASQDASRQSDVSPQAMTPGAGASLQPLVYQPKSDPAPGSATPVADSSLVYRPGIDPAPTFTEVTIPPIVSQDACTIAHTDCVNAAGEAARNDGDNDTPHFIDLSNCNSAELGCQTLSWTVEDIPFLAETGEGGGVLFPHGGVVIVQKGRLDRYYPPYPDGRPSFRRSVGAQRDRGKSLRVEGNLCPPWCVPPDETIVSSTVRFSPCRKVIGLFTARMDATVTNRACSLSKQWGKVIRAKIAYTSNGSPATALVTCWYTSDSHMGIFMKLDGCCGHGAGCS